MAHCTDYSYIRASDLSEFDREFAAGAEIQVEGIYACRFCTLEIVGLLGARLPDLPRRDHADGCIGKTWRLLVAVEPQTDSINMAP